MLRGSPGMVMVTGAAGGIGAPLCRRFAAEGAQTVMAVDLDIDTDRLVEFCLQSVDTSMLEAFLAGVGPGVEAFTVLEMLARIATAVGTRIAPTVLGTAATEIPAQHLDSTAARTELGWRPGIGLDEGLRRTAGWYRRYLAQPAAAR